MYAGDECGDAADDSATDGADEAAADGDGATAAVGSDEDGVGVGGGDEGVQPVGNWRGSSDAEQVPVSGWWQAKALQEGGLAGAYGMGEEVVLVAVATAAAVVGQSCQRVLSMVTTQNYQGLHCC